MAKPVNIVASMMRTWCVIALVMVGFAHAPIVAAPLGSVEMTAYLLPNGTSPVFCINDEASTKPVKAVSHGCEACRLSAAALLPAPTGVAERIVHFLPVDIALVREATLARWLYPPNARPRAPPAVMSS
jgi:hypothetical protein